MKGKRNKGDDDARPQPSKTHSAAGKSSESSRRYADVQFKASSTPDTADIHQTANAGTMESGGPLPHLDQIQNSFGAHDISSVNAHTGSTAQKATKSLGASAYTMGDNAVFGGTPSLHTAAHEAAHVVQQRRGVSIPGGVGQAGDTYERQADQVADAVVQGKSAEGILGKPTSGRSDSTAVQGAAGMIQQPGVGGPGKEYASGIGEMEFSFIEQIWIDDVLRDPVMQIVFRSYADIPQVVLHRVRAINKEGSTTKGQFSQASNELAISDQIYEPDKKDSHSLNGETFEESDEEAFKGTLCHELMHYLEHNTDHLDGKIAIPSNLIAVMQDPQSAGFPAYAFGWFLHPGLQGYFHFQMDGTYVIPPRDNSINDHPHLVTAYKENTWERSPMPESGNSVSIEEDLCESFGLAMASPRTREVLKTNYPMRFALLTMYIKSLGAAGKQSE